MELKHNNVNSDLFDNHMVCEKTLINPKNDNNEFPSQDNISLCSQEKLKLSSWGLPKKLLQFYETKGITHMFQWQLECLTVGNALNGGNLIYSAPTSAGKTLVAEILITKTIFELHKKVLVILPFVSVVREKMFYFQEMYTSSGIHVEGYMGGHSPSVSFKQVHLAVCTIEKANSIINKLLEERSLQNMGLVVVDELHLLGDPYRGYLLELLLTKLKYISSKSNFKIQIVAMSATLPNLKSLADWLNGDLYYTSFRPVPLHEKLKCGVTLYDKKLNKLLDLTPLSSEVMDDSENVGQLCLETIANGHSVLIFCPTKVWCENLAEKISQFFRKLGCSKSAEVEGTPGYILRRQLDLVKINQVIEHLKMSPVGLDKDLLKTVSYGVAFHHAGLTLDERDIVEGSFKQGSIRVLCATSTLSSGVNLPARRVIIRSPMSFGGLMDILTYRQMIGRAGRMGVDSEGESILICKSSERTLCQTLMNSTLKPIESCLGHGRLSASLKRALLEIVASGISSSPEEVKNYAGCTFLAHTAQHDMEDPIQSCIKFLEENEFIRLQENGNLYVPTPLGKACLASSLPPDEGLALFRELQRARRCFVLDTDLHIIYQVTPYSVSEQWSKIDWLNVLNILESLPASMKKVGELVGVEEGFLVRVVKGIVNPNCPDYRNKLSIHRRFYTSLALQDLVNEIPLSKVAEKFECNKGMLQSLQQSAATYAGMVTEFTKRLGWGSVELIFSQFQERLQFGIQRELCELMRLPLLNAVRARALFNSGFTSLSSIANANTTDLENVFFSMAPFQSKKEIPGETTYDKEQRNKLETIWITGKADLSIREAAESLIAESRNILELELGLEGAQWGAKNSDSSILKSSKSKSFDYSTTNKTISENGILNSSRHRNDFNEKINISKNVTLCEEKLRSYEKNNLEKINSPKIIKNSIISQIQPLSDIRDEYHSSKNISNVNVIIHKPNLNFEGSTLADFEEDGPKPVVDDVKADDVSTNECIDEEKMQQFSTPDNPKNKTDYFASSFNFDMVIDCETPVVNDKKIIKVGEIKSSSDFISKNESLISDNETNSNCSIEILCDSMVHCTSKNLNLSKLSEDMFEISKRGNDNFKKMSTPLSSQSNKNITGANLNCSRIADSGSPDLFSQSLTFDTQLGKILDFEEPPGEDNPVIINQSASFNSDDLGFVSDLSPPNAIIKKTENLGYQNISTKIKEHKNRELQNAGMTASFFEIGFKSPLEDIKCEHSETINKTKKRKAVETNSPDLIVDSDESVVENKHTSKRIKSSSLDNKNIFTESSKPLNGYESEDEIISTPKLEKNILKNFSRNKKVRSNSIQNNSHRVFPNKINQKSKSFPRNVISAKLNVNSSNRVTKKTIINQFIKPSENNKCGLDKIKYDKINIIDVCEEEMKFRSFCEELKKQNIVGLALGCRKKLDNKKNIIGAKIMKRKKLDNRKEENFKCHYNEIILDGIAFYWEGYDVYYMSLEDENIQLIEKIDLLRNLSTEKIIFRIFDVKEQIKMLYRCTSVLLVSSYQDPKIASWLLSESWKEKNFSTLAFEYLPTLENIISQIGSVVGYSSPGLLFKSSTSHRTRACCEAFITYHLINTQLNFLREKRLEKLYENIEMPIILVLVEMELAGFQLSKEVLFLINDKLIAAKGALEEKAYSLAKQKFSISSSIAVSKILHKELSLEGENIALTKKRKLPSTSKQALQELAKQTNHPLIEVILQWRKVRSVLSKFVSPLLISSSHASRVFGVSQTFTVTGRISMHEPNLQNIPKKFTLDCGLNEHSTYIILRDVFVASENCTLISADYCQIELRILAHLSQDLDLIRSINDSTDIFISIAADIYGLTNYNVDDNLRQKVKQTCYGIIYGIGSRALSEQLGIEESNAEELLEDFKRKYPGVKNYLEKIISDCKRKGYVSTMLGRRRYLPAINDSNQTIRMEAERQAVNTTIQGSAADLVKSAMILFRQKICELRSDGTVTHLVLHLHDELIFEVQNEVFEKVIIILKESMEDAMSLSVPIPVKLKSGLSWGNLKDLEF